MAGLRRSHQEAVHRLLRNRQDRVALNATWRRLHAHFETGTVDGHWLAFDRDARETLRRLAQAEWGFDPLQGVPDGSRAEVAAQAIDEKIARQRPDDGFVLVKGALPAPLPALPAQASLRVPIGHLADAAIEQILVVENLDSFDCLEQYPIPAELQDALVLYRGHGGLARGARHLLEGLAGRTRVTVFGDYDPAGLAIAATLPGANTVLVPVLGEQLLRSGNPRHFLLQHRASRYLDSSELGGWQELWEEMRRHGLSIKQQHMLALGCELRVVTRLM